MRNYNRLLIPFFSCLADYSATENLGDSFQIAASPSWRWSAAARMHYHAREANGVCRRICGFACKNIFSSCCRATTCRQWQGSQLPKSCDFHMRIVNNSLHQNCSFLWLNVSSNLFRIQRTEATLSTEIAQLQHAHKEKEAEISSMRYFNRCWTQ